MPNTAHQQSGFVLITSLVFLVVITLLAVSAMNRSTLQERMASNIREQSLARQAANAALRNAESQFAKDKFHTYQTSDSQSLLTLLTDRLFGQNKPDNSTILAFSGWDNSQTKPPKPSIYERPHAADDAPFKKVQYYVQEFEFAGRNLNPNTAAVADGTAYYRITARATHGDRAAVVTQSTYAKHY